jgi:hypothetical protein
MVVVVPVPVTEMSSSHQLSLAPSILASYTVPVRIKAMHVGAYHREVAKGNLRASYA